MLLIDRKTYLIDFVNQLIGNFLARICKNQLTDFHK